MSHIAILIQPAAKYFCRGRIPAELTFRLLTCETDDFLEQTFMALFKRNEKGVLRRHAEAIQEGFVFSIKGQGGNRFIYLPIHPFIHSFLAMTYRIYRLTLHFES